MPSQESIAQKNEWAERSGRETIPGLERRGGGAFDGAKFEGETPRENEKRSQEEIEQEQLTEFLNAMPIEKLRFEQERLQAFVDEVGGNTEDLAELSPETAAAAQELIKNELALLEAIKIRRVHREDVLTKLPKNRIPNEALQFVTPDSDLPFRPTEYPGGPGPKKQELGATVPPPLRKKRAQDISTSRTELPKSDLPN